MYAGERFNSITHIAGAALAAVGGLFLLAAARSSGDGWRIAASSVYAATLLQLYMASSLYHGARGAAKVVLRSWTIAPSISSLLAPTHLLRW